jgi:hypothetical protein
MDCSARFIKSASAVVLIGVRACSFSTRPQGSFSRLVQWHSRRGSCSALQDRVGLLAQASERDAQLARGDLMGLSVDTLVHAEQFLGLDGEGQLTAPAAVRDSSHGRPNRRCDQTCNVCSGVIFDRDAGSRCPAMSAMPPKAIANSQY